LPHQLAALDGFLLFQASDNINGFRLWRSDGTADGTIPIHSLGPGFFDLYAPRPIAVDGLLYFRLNAGDGNGSELWESDGTAEGTSLVKDINSGYPGSRIDHLVEFNSRLFFTADDGVHGNEPWESDGTTNGTVLVRDIVPGSP